MRLWHNICMLDDNNQINQLDRSNALAVIGAQTEQLKQSFSFATPKGNYQNIVLAGMGGSALAAEFIRSWLQDRLALPLVIVRDYQLPKFVGQHSLVIVSSYSGNTEETLSALASAEKLGCQIVVVCAGGKLQEQAEAKGYPFIQLPANYQPRMAVLFGVRALAQLLQELELVPGVVGELEEAADWAAGLQSWGVQAATDQNLAKQIAQNVHGGPAVIYAGPTLGFLAMKWKIDFNENGKNLAFYNTYPEFNHNEFMGWSNAGQALRVINLHSKLDHPQIRKRMEVSVQLQAGHMQVVNEVVAEGGSRLEQMLWTFQLGGFASLYLAFLNGVDPTPVDLIEDLKQRLA